VVLGEPNMYHDSGVFYKNEDFTWRVSDFEELVGVTHRRWWGATARSSFVWSGYCLSLSDL